MKLIRVRQISAIVEINMDLYDILKDVLYDHSAENNDENVLKIRLKTN